MINPNSYENKILAATDFYRAFGDDYDGDGRYCASAVLTELLRHLDDKTIGEFFNTKNGLFDGLTAED